VYCTETDRSTKIQIEAGYIVVDVFSTSSIAKSAVMLCTQSAFKFNYFAWITLEELLKWDEGGLKAS